MSRLQGKDQDVQVVENAKKRNLDCANDPGCHPWKYVEAEAREETAPSAEPEKSDYFPSVSLAAFLALVFALVSLSLLSHDRGPVPLHDCLALTSSKAGTPESSLEFLCLLFPNQPEPARQTLQHYGYEQRVGSHPGRAWILAAVALGDAWGTLLCLPKATLSLLTDDRAARVQFLEQRSVWLPWMDFLENGTCGISTANIYVGRSLVPYGMVVSLQSSSDGKWLATKINLALLLNGLEQDQEEFLLPAVISTMISDILSAVCFADRVPGQLMITGGSLPDLLMPSATGRFTVHTTGIRPAYKIILWLNRTNHGIKVMADICDLYLQYTLEESHSGPVRFLSSDPQGLGEKGCLEKLCQAALAGSVMMEEKRAFLHCPCCPGVGLIMCSHPCEWHSLQVFLHQLMREAGLTKASK